MVLMHQIHCGFHEYLKATGEKSAGNDAEWFCLQIIMKTLDLLIFDNKD
jgi:hypothetical protein